MGPSSGALDDTRLARIVLWVLASVAIFFQLPGLSLAESDEIPPVPGSSVTEEAWDSDTASEPEIGSPETPATTPEETMGTDGAPAALSTESEIPDTPMMNVTSISGIPRDGLLVEYLFEGNAQDSSGMGHHPSLVELDTYDPSRFGQSLEIGAGGKVQIASDTDLNLAMIREVTIAFWFRETPSTHSSTSAQVPLFGYITSNYWPNYIDRNIYLRWNTGEICMFFFYDNISCSSGTNYADGQWHLVIQQVAQTGGTSLYVDGNLVASSTRNYADTYQTPYMQLYSTGPIQSLRVDNFRYYNRLLSAGERQALQNESFAASCSDQIRNQDETSVDYGGVCGKIPASGLVAHYGFDGDTTDDGPYANHLSHPPGMTFLSGVRELSLGFNWGPYSPSLKIGTGSTSFQFASGMTASAWVYLESGKDGTVFSRMNGPDGGMNMFANRINESLLMFAMQIDPWNHMAIYLPDVTSSNWTHLVMTTDSKYVYAYFNGERVFIGKGPHATMFPNAAYSNVNDLLIGEWWNRPNMHGRLDELYFYDRALSPDEVKRLYLASSEPVARLELLASSPAPASSDVALLSDLRLSFSRPIDPASLSGSVTLRRAGVTVPVRLVLDREWYDILLRPASGLALSSDTDYEVSLGTALASVSWEHLSAPANIAFRTGRRAVGAGLAYDPLRELMRAAVPDWDRLATARSEAEHLSAAPETTNVEGDPVDLRTGEFTYDNTVMRLPGVGISYEFALRYRSRVVSDGPLGAGWRVSYDRSIELRPDGTAVYHDENFGTHEFAPSGTGYAYLESYRARLSRTSTGFHLSFDDLTGMEFTLSGTLASINDASGNAIRFSQDSSGRTVSATDTVGRTIAYSYTASGQLALLASSDGRRVAFEYSDGEYGDLARVRMGRGESEREISFGYAPDTPYIELAHNLATLTDTAGNVYVENTYDADDRVVSQRYGTGTIAYEYSLGNIHADDSPMATGTGEVVGHYVSLNRATDRRGMIVEHAYDRFGHLTERRVYATGAETRVTSYAYDAAHRLVAETLPQGGGTRYAYDARGNRVETRQKADMALPDDDAADIVERREYDSANDRLTRRIAPDGSVTEHTYDSRLRLAETTVRDVRLDASSTTGTDLRTTYEYDSLGQLTRTVDPSGRATSLAYEDGRPVSVTRHGSGADITESYAYDAYGNIESVTDAAGHTRSMTYDEYDRLVSATSAEGVVRSLGYDASGNITLESLSQSGTLASQRTRAYDGLDLPVTATESVSADVAVATATIYDAGGNISAVTMPDGTVRRYEYDESGRPVRVSVEPAGTWAAISTSYEYDADGHLTREIDALGHATNYTYDGFGRLTRVTDALGAYSEYSYDRLGNVTKSVAKNSSGAILRETIAEWNSIGLPLSTATMSGSVALATTYAYDAAGQIIRQTDPLGHTQTYSYDSLGRLMSEIDALGNTISYAYDVRSLLVSRTVSGSGGLSVATHMAYDGDGRLVREWRTQSGAELATSYRYDAAGRLTLAVGPEWERTAYTYDLAGRLLSETRSGSGLSATTAYTYDSMGRTLSVTDPGGAITRYEYDALGRLSRERAPDDSTTSYAYDAVGNIISTTQSDGTTVSDTYDALSRLVRRDIAAGSGTLGVSWEAYSYDAFGRLATATDSLGQDLSWAYDAAGRLTAETAYGLATRYAYDSAGQLSALSYPSGQRLDIARDALGRPLSLAVGATEHARYAYSGAELSRIDYANASRAELSYDGLARLSGLSHLAGTGTVWAESYAYDRADRLVADSRGTYAYDPLSRLARAVDTVEYDAMKRQTTRRGNAYSYDAAGNREKVDRFASVTRIVNVCKTVKVAGVNTRVCEDETRESESSYVLEAYESNDLNQYDESVRHPDMSNRDETGYAYDLKWNLISDGAYLYGYDYRNRLVRITRVSDNRILKEITYDVLGRKTGWKSNSTSVRLVYAGNQMIEEYSRLHSNPFNLVASYVWGERNSDDIVAMSRGGQTYYYHTDRLGSVVALTNSSGAIVERYSYDAYGIPSVWSDDLGRYRSMGDSAVGNTLLYTGRPYDRIVGLHDMRARQYSANLGRFISRDPIGMADDVNLYAYVANSPLVYVDRFGKEKAALQSRFPYPGDIFNSLLWIDVAGDASPEKTAQLKRMEQADLLLIVAGGAGLVKSLTKSAVRASPAVFDEAAYMKNSMSDAMEAIRQWRYKAVIGGGWARQSSGFRDIQMRDRHYIDHWGDFGATSAESYEKMANDFMVKQLDTNTLEKVRANGDVVRYNTSSEEFWVITKDNILRTYYKPNPDVHKYPSNLDYFNGLK